MDKSTISLISTGLAVGCSCIAVRMYMSYATSRFKSQVPLRVREYVDWGRKDFIDHGSYSSFWGGTVFLFLYFLVIAWAYHESKDIILTLGAGLMFGYFGFLGLYEMLAVYIRRIEFRGDLLIYRNLPDARFTLKRNDIVSIEIGECFFYVHTQDKKYSISGGFRNPYRIYAKLIYWGSASGKR